MKIDIKDLRESLNLKALPILDKKFIEEVKQIERPKVYNCSECSFKTHNYRILGGHFKNRHPGKSTHFNKK